MASKAIEWCGGVGFTTTFGVEVSSASWSNLIVLMGLFFQNLVLLSTFSSRVFSEVLPRLQDRSHLRGNLHDSTVNHCKEHCNQVQAMMDDD